MRTLNVVALSYFFLVVSAGIAYTWVGNTDSNWTTADNWEPSGVPSTNDTVQVKDTTGNTNIQLGSEPISIIALYFNSTSVTINSGSLTVTSYTFLNSVAFNSVTLVSKGSTIFDGSYAGGTNMSSSTWTIQGTLISDYNLVWQLVNSQIINYANFSATGLLSITGDHNSSFSNLGALTISDNSGSIIGVSFTNSGTFALLTGSLEFRGLDVKASEALTTVWNGTLFVGSGATQLVFLAGQHFFNEGIVWEAHSLVVFTGYEAAQNWMNVTFNEAVNFSARVVLDMTCSVMFNQQTIFSQLEFDGGLLTGSGPIIIQNLNGSCNFSNPICPIFSSSSIYIINATGLSTTFQIDRGTTLNINGTVEQISHTWTYVTLDDVRDGGTLTVHPSGILSLHAFSDSFVPRHEFNIPVIMNGLVRVVPPITGGSCVDNDEVATFNNGGVVAGEINTIDCGNNDAFDNADINFAGFTTFLEGTKFTGEGSIGLEGILSTTYGGDIGDKFFNFSYNITVPFKVYSAEVNLHVSSDLHFSQFIWNSGQILSPAGVTLYLDAGGDHTIDGEFNSPNNLDATQMINFGSLDLTGAPRFTLMNGAKLTNRGTVWLNSQTFTGRSNFFDNYGIVNISDGGLESAIFNNYGYILTPTTSKYNAVDIRTDGANFTLTETSVFTINIYGNTANGAFSQPYDVIDMVDASECSLAGELVVKFVAPFSPTVGSIFKILIMPQDLNGGIYGLCTCQFSKISTIGLANSLSVGLIYDIIYDDAAGVFANLVICNAGNLSCTTTARSKNAPCPNGPYTTSSSTSTSITSGPTVGPNPTSSNPTSTSSTMSSSDSSRLGFTVLEPLLLLLYCCLGVVIFFG